MPITVFYEELLKYRVLPHGLGFMFCATCNEEAPQVFSSNESGFISFCNVCASIKNFCRFVRHDRCKAHVEVFGFIATKKKKVLVSKNFYEKTDAQSGTLVPVVVWCADPIEHNEFCAPPIEVPP